ncbi:MAG: carbohydrate binding family 9 domain-containing protein [Acidobacteria bacterium]|nr:carbohydrate binding family 9 domain-containing protein [Acidobacteriota bacterium]
MIIPFLLTLVIQAAVAPSGGAGAEAPSATAPRIEATVEIDGRLDEPAWSQAARLTDFRQRIPIDANGGGPATERSEVLIWYSPEALHLGVVARDSQAASIRASMARRDGLDQEDTVSFYLDTFNDRRRAFVFTVNPLGAQQDGVQSEGGGGGVGGGGGSGGSLDRSPDYRFDSAGRLTELGYTVEVRIPFKSLRYPGNGPQRWGFNVSRKVQRTGHEDTWAEVRPGASFLAQAGMLDGIHDLRRGLVTEIQPFATGARGGARLQSGAFERGALTGSGGVNGRLGFTNLSIDATVNPDFSQVESDAGVVTVNERFALSFPEKRPFFLEGIELFSTPNRLVYTRQIVNPAAGGKLTGKVGGFSIAHLTALDEKAAGDALFNITRLRRDFGRSSLAGLTYTDEVSDGTSNRVLAGDVRLVFRRLYYAQVQLGRSWSGTRGLETTSPIWNVIYDRTGRVWGFHYEVNGVGEQFESRAGFVPRRNFVQARYWQRLTYDAPRGALVEQLNVRFNPSRTWNYGEFLERRPIEGEDSFVVQTRLRGGWSVNADAGWQYYRLDPADYQDYEIQRQGVLEPFLPPASLEGLFAASVSVDTPAFQMFTGSVDLARGEVPIFAEASAGRETRLSTALAFRPASSMRAEVSATVSRIARQRDGSPYASTTIPRLKIEYQPQRTLFFRIVAEYRSERREALLARDSTLPIYVGGVPRPAQQSNGLRVDCLASFEPTPGTAAYIGYGAALAPDRAGSLGDLRRTADGFFVKVAYQIRR